MKHRIISTFYLISGLGLAGLAAAQETTLRPGKGLAFASADGSATLNIGGRMQVRHTFEEMSDSSTFSVPRLRLTFKGTLYRDWSWQIQTDHAKKEKTTLKDGFVERTFSPAARLRFGQFLVGFDRQQLESSGKYTFADHNIVSAGLGMGRDVGVQLLGRAMNGVLQYNAGLFNGAGEASPSPNGGHTAVARVSLNPLGDFGLSQGDVSSSPAPRVFVEAAAYHSQDSSLGSLDGTTGLAAGAGVRYAGAYAVAEYIRSAPHEGAATRGWYAQASYMLIPARLEAAARHARLDPDADADDDLRTETSAALNVFFAGAGHNLKLTGDVALLTDDARTGDERQRYRTRTQFQLAF